MHRSILLLLSLAAFSVAAWAHDSTQHKKRPPAPVATSDSAHHHVDADSTAAVMETMAPLKEFPTLHPLVVHIPIVFLLMAAVMQGVSLLFFKRELSWTAWVILLVGFAGAYASSTWFHAHTTGLSPEAQQILEEHEAYANYTIWLSGSALVLQSVNLFFLRRKAWLNAAVAALTVAAAVVVALAGHHGAELVHKQGIGAKGYKLEQHHH